jgi:hypothetical protein
MAARADAEIGYAIRAFRSMKVLALRRRPSTLCGVRIRGTLRRQPSSTLGLTPARSAFNEISVLRADRSVRTRHADAIDRHPRRPSPAVGV